MLDADGNGKISAKELSDAFKGKNTSKMYWKNIISDADIDGDGSV